MTDWEECATAPASSWADAQPEPASTFAECGVAPDSTWNLCRAGGSGVAYVVTRSTATPGAGALVTITAQFVDALGAPVLEAGHTVTWSKTGAGGSFALPTTDTDANGQAVVVFTVGTVAAIVNTVTATDELARTGTTGSITVQPGAVASLEFLTAPAGATGDLALTTQPVVRCLDAYGNIATNATAAISATVDVGTLTGAGPIVPVAGVATFTALTFVDIPFVRAGNRVLTFTSAAGPSLAASALLVKLGNDLAAWYADDTANTLDGSTPPHLLTAADLSGHSKDLASTGTILRQASLQNAKPGFDFATAGANYLADLAIGVQGSFTWFGVFKITSSASYQNLFDRLVVPITWLFWDQPTNKWQVGDRLAGTAVAGSYVTLVVHFINNGAQVQVVVRANGVSLLNSFLTSPGALLPGSAGVPSNTTFPQFRRPPATLTFTSLMMEWGFYSLSKNGLEASLESYLRTKYATW